MSFVLPTGNTRVALVILQSIFLQSKEPSSKLSVLPPMEALLEENFKLCSVEWEDKG